MSWRKLSGAMAAAIVVITLPPVLLLSNFYLLATPAFLRNEYGKAGFPAAPGFTDAERLRFAEATLAYVRSRQSIEMLKKLEHNGEPLYNWRELVHLADVQFVIHWVMVVHAAATILLLLAVIYIWRRPDLRPRLPVYLFWGCLALVVPMLAIAAFALANFDLFFIFFHRLFFAGDSWLFAASDSLIRLFPLPFWMDAAFTWVVLACGEAVVIGAAAYLWPGWRHK